MCQIEPSSSEKDGPPPRSLGRRWAGGACAATVDDRPRARVARCPGMVATRARKDFWGLGIACVRGRVWVHPPAEGTVLGRLIRTGRVRMQGPSRPSSIEQENVGLTTSLFKIMISLPCTGSARSREQLFSDSAALGGQGPRFTTQGLGACPCPPNMTDKDQGEETPGMACQ